MSKKLATATAAGADLDFGDFIASCSASANAAFNEFIEKSDKKDLYNWLWHPISVSKEKYFEALFRISETLEQKEETEYQKKVNRITKLVKTNKVEGAILEALCNEAGILPSDIITTATGEKNLPLFFYFMCPILYDGSERLIIANNLCIQHNSETIEEIEIDSNKISMMPLNSIANSIGTLMVAFLRSMVNECSDYEFPKNVQLVKIAGMFENALVAYNIYLEQKALGNEVRGD